MSQAEASPTESTSSDTGPVSSIIVTCKGRTSHLKQTLDRMLNQLFRFGNSFEYEVVVVEYGDDELREWLPAQYPARPEDCVCESLTMVSVQDNTQHFNLSRARNIGGVVAAGDILVFLDADALLGHYYLDTITMPIFSGNASMVVPDWKLHGPTRKNRGKGVCAVTREVFHSVRGFDEGMRGWGYEDEDFWLRARQAGSTVVEVETHEIEFIQHDDELRHQHYEIKNHKASKRLNKQHATTREIVNPHGYGVSQSRLYVW
jgi:glycosyltransferase involved in cell wall biosynthesis